MLCSIIKLLYDQIVLNKLDVKHMVELSQQFLLFFYHRPIHNFVSVHNCGFSSHAHKNISEKFDVN